MPFEMTVGLRISDEEKYRQYRAEMVPLLYASGGLFRYDFEIARTLIPETDQHLNRVFVIQFPDRDGRDRLFSDPRYLDIRRRLFETAVSSVRIIAEYSA